MVKESLISETYFCPFSMFYLAHLSLLFVIYYKLPRDYIYIYSNRYYLTVHLTMSSCRAQLINE